MEEVSVTAACLEGPDSLGLLFNCLLHPGDTGNEPQEHGSHAKIPSPQEYHPERNQYEAIRKFHQAVSRLKPIYPAGKPHHLSKMVPCCIPAAPASSFVLFHRSSVTLDLTSEQFAAEGLSAQCSSGLLKGNLQKQLMLLQ